jgi:hypothetical protein
MGFEFHEEKMMPAQQRVKMVHEGQYVAEVDVDIIESEDAWAPYLSESDARKLDEVRLALRRGDIASAARLSRVFQLTPVRAA